MNKTAKKSITWHSPIRLERPSTTLLGRMRQRIQILAGDLLTPTSQPEVLIATHNVGSKSEGGRGNLNEVKGATFNEVKTVT